jgi:hypothetical protein
MLTKRLKSVWSIAAVCCVVTAAWLVVYEKLPVTVTNETPLYVASRDGKQGVVTTWGRVVVPFVWEEIREFDGHGMAVVVKETASVPKGTNNTEIIGVINRSGHLVVPAELNQGASGFDDHGHYVGQLADRLVVYDRSGRQIMFSEWEPLADLQFDSLGLIAAKNGDDVGWINRDGVLQVHAPNGLTPVSNFHPNGLAVVANSGGKQGCVDQSGQIVIATKWDEIDAQGLWYRGSNGDLLRDDNLIQVKAVDAQAKSLWGVATKGYLSRDGQTMIPAIYDLVLVKPEQKLAVVIDVNDKWGIVDLQGNIIIPLEYDDLTSFDEQGLAAAEKQEKWGWINRQGAIVIPFEYDDLSRSMRSAAFDNNNLAIVKKNGLWGAINSSGEPVIPFQYSNGHHCADDSEWLGFERDGRWGCLDHHGNVVVPFEYDYHIIFDVNDLAVARKHGRCFAIDRKGVVQPMSTEHYLSVLNDELQIEDFRESLELYRELTAGKFLVARATVGTSYGDGVFSVIDGMIVPPIHASVAITRYGFRAEGDNRETVFSKYFVGPKSLLGSAFPALQQSTDDLEVLYDFEGREIWRSDTRRRSIFSAWVLAFAAAMCFWQSKRTARKI